MDIVKYEPTQIVKIAVGELTVPVEAAAELSRLALIEKNILVEYLKDAKRDEETNKWFVPQQALQWSRELRMLLKDIHEINKGVEEKVMMERIDISKIIFKEMAKKMDNEELVSFVKTLSGKKNEVKERVIIEPEH